MGSGGEGSCRLAGEGGQQGGCPAGTSSRRGVGEREDITDSQLPVWIFEFQYTLDGTHARTLEGDDSAGADSGRRRGGTGGGTTRSSEPRLKLTMDDTEDDPESTHTQARD